MSQHNGNKGDSAKQSKQAANKKSSKDPAQPGFDKKLDGPNRPSI